MCCSILKPANHVNMLCHLEAAAGEALQAVWVPQLTLVWSKWVGEPDFFAGGVLVAV